MEVWEKREIATASAIVFRVSQILENNKNCLVNSLVMNSIVLACLETLEKHSHLFMKYYINIDHVIKKILLNFIILYYFSYNINNENDGMNISKISTWNCYDFS